MTRRVGLDHSAPTGTPRRARTLITIAAAIIAVFLLILTCTNVDTAKAAPTSSTVWYVDTIACPTGPTSSAVTHRYPRLGDAVGAYGRALIAQHDHAGKTAQVRMRQGTAGSVMSRLVHRSIKKCAR